jgi:hypothetical protein
MIKGREFHSIINSVFDGDVRGINEGEQLQTNCPKCQQREGLSSPDNKYNLEINTDKRVFRCWKCDSPKFSGSLGRLIKIFGTPTDYELYKSYAGSIIDYSENDDEKDFGFVELPNEFVPFSKMDADNPLHLEAYNYMILERQIQYDVLVKFGIGFCTEGSHWGRIIIPSYDQHGDLNYFVARAYKGQKPPYMNPKADKDVIIFNEGLINWDSTIYIVEGVFEWLSFPVNTVPQLGKTLSSAFFFKLKIKKPKIVIVLDPDAYKDSIQIYQKLSLIYGDERDRIKIVRLRGNYDMDEIRVKFGKDSLIKKLRTARQLEVDDYFVGNKYFYEQNHDWKTNRANNKWQ